MAPDERRSRNNYRFHPYHSHTDSPLRFLQRPTDLNARSVPRLLFSGGSQQQDSTPSSLVDSSLTPSSTDPPSHQEDSTQAEDDSTLGSSSNPIDLTGLVIHSQTPPRKGATRQGVAQSHAPSQPEFIKQREKEVKAHTQTAWTKKPVIHAQQASQLALLDQHTQPRARSQQAHDSPLDNQRRQPSHSNPTKEAQTKPLPSNKTPSQPQPPQQPPTAPLMIPQKRPNPQPLSQPPGRPTQHRRLNPPPPAPPITRPAPPPTNNNNNMSLPTQILTTLQSQSLPLPSHPWLNHLITTRNPPLPLPSLLATTRARILSSDLTTPSLLDPSYLQSHSFPPSLSNPTTKSTSLSHDVVVQVLDITNISKSKWEQVEELEAKARGEEKRGREVIRLPTAAAANDEDTNVMDQGMDQGALVQQQQNRERGEAKATHKVLVQDGTGQKVFALELFRLEKLGIGKTNIGEKWLLKKGMGVSRGVVMLEPERCVFLGGKVEVWNKAWSEGRLERLRKEAGEQNGGG
ncbi:hypothetical protein QBC40DRAFT_316177 [Triangularia verruculosa]|uniref:RecQ mediated genome instability protein 1 N-terminal domain-containing protein n=1 Tax=Triangularia verruculosa TaxID=2587418 RepID=A0AAN6XMT0_9PEZI|nr:hypothetical protein QBC40DRAFT_316177 [Triangularia verruculosa]